MSFTEGTISSCAGKESRGVESDGQNATQRERVYAALIDTGQTSKAIAFDLGLTRQVVAKHLRALWLADKARVIAGICGPGQGGGTATFVWVRK